MLKRSDSAYGTPAATRLVRLAEPGVVAQKQATSHLNTMRFVSRRSSVSRLEGGGWQHAAAVELLAHRLQTAAQEDGWACIRDAWCAVAR